MDGRSGDVFILFTSILPGIEEERSFDDFTIPQNNEFGGGQRRRARNAGRVRVGIGSIRGRTNLDEYARDHERI